MADRLATIAAWSCATVVTGVFLWLLTDIAWSGVGHLSWSFLTEAPRNAGRAGGIGPILVSTGLLLGVCLGVSLPVGLGTAIRARAVSASRWGLTPRRMAFSDMDKDSSVTISPSSKLGKPMQKRTRIGTDEIDLHGFSFMYESV